MSIPINYRKSQEQTISNYDYTEVSSGRAVLKLYLCDFNVPPAYQLLEGIQYGMSGCTMKSATNSFDLDFDLSLTRPIAIQGKASVTIPMVFTGNAAFSETFTARIRKYHDSTETELVSGSILAAGNAGTGFIEKRLDFGLDIPLTVFQAGDLLRVSFTSDAIDASTEATMGHDPKNRSDLGTIFGIAATWATNGSEAFALIPVRLDI